MVEYQLTQLGAIIRNSDGAIIPGAAPGNRDWDEYQLWVDAGGVADPYVPPPPPPDFPNEISDRQFFQALAQTGQITQDEALAAVGTGTVPAQMEAAIASLPTDEQFPARMLVTGAVVFHRDSDTVAMLRQTLGWTDQQTDDLWKLAASL